MASFKPTVLLAAAASVIALAACSADSSSEPQAAAQPTPVAPATTVSSTSLPASQQQWWDALHALCGNAYEGTLIRAPEGDNTFRDARVLMHVRDCSDTRVRVPLVIGDNYSRVWVFSQDNGRLLFRHEHRHEDGSEESASQYGGYTSNAGSADTQMFPGDDITTTAIPGSGQRSVWLVEIHPGDKFVYSANRVGTERGFQVDFDLTKPVEVPPAPWGWQD